MITINAELRRALLMLQVVLVLSVATCIQAQTPTPTPKSEEVQKLEEQKAQLDLRKGIAEDEKAIRDAKFPKPTTTPLAGTTTVSDGAVIETQMVAYVSMARAANKLVSALKIEQGQMSNLAIFNEADVKLLLSYKVADKQIEMLRQEYGRLLADDVLKGCALPPASPGPGVQDFNPSPLGIANSFLGAFVDLTALLRTNVEIKGQSFDIDEAPLVAEVFRAARCQYGSGIHLYYPAVFPPDIDPNKEYAILGRLQELHCLRIVAGKVISDIDQNTKDITDSDAKIKTLKATVEQTKAQKDDAEAKMKQLLKAYCPKFPLDQSLTPGFNDNLKKFCPRMPAEQREDLFELHDQIAALGDQLSALALKVQTETEKKGQLEQARKVFWAKLGNTIKVSTAGGADDIAAQLKALNDQFDKLINSFLQAETATGVNQLTMFIKAENLKTALPASGSYWLQLKVLKAGGNNRIKTNLIWDIFTGGNRVSHSGGAIVEYILYDTSGRSVASDTITEYTNYIKANKIKNLPDSSIDVVGCPCVTNNSKPCQKETNQ